ncbi:uncharacterized protein LOC111086927 isoform X2 [Limulus polyphemus]|uniref:Uncharacterized protein LOC111086927 isoform X2 n=1 Tax=Limulus polyphemus TaxID=6850 RepID=A0ABM1SV20_LIMPO|nr:uncharacterized protein LOC111086927 isoform X2 [Limulus polyphemus]
MTAMQQLQLMIYMMMFTSCLVSKGYVLHKENGRQDQIPSLRATKDYRSEADIWTFPPRIGRSAVFDFLPFSYIMAEDLIFKLYEDMDSPKHSMLAFTPRIGRKKRSISEEYDDWQLNDDYINKAKRAMFTPRIGRASYIPRIGRANTGALSSLLL